MTRDEVMSFLEKHGNGAKEPMFGTRIADMKVLMKKVKKDYELSKELWATGNSDAMYFAGLIADETKMTKRDLKKWAKEAYWYMLREYSVAAVAAETPHGVELANTWIASSNEGLASAGWSTYASWISIAADEELDHREIEEHMDRIAETIHQAQNRVRYTMNNFIICVGSYIPALSEKAQELAKRIGKVNVDMGGTACKVPLASDYIKKVIDKGRMGKKRKQARC